MSVRTPAAAIGDLVTALQTAVSCILKTVIVQGRVAPDAPHVLSLAQRFVPLGGRHRLALSVLYTFTVRQTDLGSWRASATGYWYHLDQRAGSEVIAFHWRPNGHGHVPFPHLHVDGGTGSVRIGRKGHVPTGRVSLEGVVRFAIEALGRPPAPFGLARDPRRGPACVRHRSNVVGVFAASIGEGRTSQRSDEVEK